MTGIKGEQAWAMPISQKQLDELSSDRMQEGTSGVYLLSKGSESTAIFKPATEEYLPEDVMGWGLELGLGVRREQAAFILSEALEGFPGVPFTGIFEVASKEGSVQRFVGGCTDMSDLGPNGLVDEEVQKIALMDLLTFNIDRHEGNILLHHATKTLIPIDHAQCLPEVVRADGANAELLRSLYFAWQTWPQAKAPWTAEAQRIAGSISPERLAEQVASGMGPQALSDSALASLKVGAVVLKTCVALGLSAAAIADLVRDELSSLLDAAAAAAASCAPSEWEAAVLSELRSRLRALLGAAESDSESDAREAVLSAAATSTDSDAGTEHGCEEALAALEDCDDCAAMPVVVSADALTDDELHDPEDLACAAASLDDDHPTQHPKLCHLKQLFIRVSSGPNGVLAVETGGAKRASLQLALSDALAFLFSRAGSGAGPAAGAGSGSVTPCSFSFRARHARSAGTAARSVRRRATVYVQGRAAGGGQQPRVVVEAETLSSS